MQHTWASQGFFFWQKGGFCWCMRVVLGVHSRGVSRLFLWQKRGVSVSILGVFWVHFFGGGLVQRVFFCTKQGAFWNKAGGGGWYSPGTVKGVNAPLMHAVHTRSMESLLWYLCPVAADSFSLFHTLCPLFLVLIAFQVRVNLLFSSKQKVKLMWPFAFL